MANVEPYRETYHCEECRGEADPPYFWTLGPFCVLCQECADYFNSPEMVAARADFWESAPAAA